MISRNARKLLGYAAILATGASSLQAQRSASAVLLGDLRPGTTLRGSTTGGQSLVGRLLSADADSLHFCRPCKAGAVDATRAIALGVIATLETRTGSRAGRGAIIGALSGIALAAILILPQEDSEDFTKATAFPLAAGLAGTVGGLVGFGIGAGNSVWVVVRLPRPRY